MPRTAISGLACTTFLVLLGFPALPEEPSAKGANIESGQQTFNNACRTCHTTKEGDNRLGPNLHNIIGRKAGSLQNYGYSSAMKGAIPAASDMLSSPSSRVVCGIDDRPEL
jgi:cytochrome c